MTHEELSHHFRATRCLVTGGAGFIGSNLTRRLLACGARVTVLDNFVTGKRENLAAADSLTVVEGDLCSLPELPEIVSQSDYVFHLAAQVGNIKSIKDPEADVRTNVLGSVRLFHTCKSTAVKKVVYSSSSAIFGESAEIPIDEERPRTPESFYALSKLAGEQYALLSQSLWGLPAVCLRYFNVFGLPMENNEYTGVISIFFHRLQADEPLVIFGDGNQCRDFIYVSDVAQANLLAAKRGKPGRVYNIGSGKATTILQLAETMIELTGSDSEIVFADFRAGEVRKSLADVRRAKAELGFAPEFEIRRGLAAIWEKIRRSASA